MKLGLRSIDWKQAGAELANAEDSEQVDFFKTFARECFTWGTKYQIEFQLSGVNSELSPEEREVFTMLSYNSEE